MVTSQGARDSHLERGYPRRLICTEISTEPGSAAWGLVNATALIDVEGSAIFLTELLDLRSRQRPDPESISPRRHPNDRN